MQRKLLTFDDLHPRELGELLSRLAPDRHMLPFDTRLDRLLNGLWDPHIYLGRCVADGRPYLAHLPLFRTHGHFYGGSGTGKTSMGILPLVIQLIALQAGSVVIVDMKNDPTLLWSSFIEAQRSGLPFKWFSLESGVASFAYNPFLQSYRRYQTRAAMIESLLISLGGNFGQGYGREHFQAENLIHLSRFLKTMPEIQSFADYARYLDEPSSFRAAGLDPETALQIQTTIRQLAMIRPFNLTPQMKKDYPETVFRDQIDLGDVVTQKQVIYFCLPTIEQEVTSKAIGRSIPSALTQAAKVMKRIGSTVPVYLILDEAQEIVGKSVRSVLEMARSQGIYCILSHQDLNQLKTTDGDLTSSFESSTTVKLVFETSSLEGLKHMSEYSGESRERLVSWPQRVNRDFDENDDEGLSPRYAHPRSEFEPPLGTISEFMTRRFTTNNILAMSAHPMRAYVRSRTDSGMTQYRGQWTEIECEYPITAREFSERSNTPWPSQHPSCITNPMFDEAPNDEIITLSNSPLPVPRPPQSVDVAISHVLEELEQSIRQQPRGDTTP